MQPETDRPPSADQLAKYRLLEEVGQGGMAIVYRGTDTTLEREVAVKILHPHLANQSESKKRFQREAQAVAKLRHENIVEIYDFSGVDSAQSYIVTEFIRGQTLKDFLHHRPISHPEIAVMVVLQVAAALGHAHSFGVIHRDIKPENIMIRDDGRIKLMDFGIAHIIDIHGLTVTGQLLGSPAYMCPELVEGKPLDFRSDLFSLGTLLYQLTTGKLPFSGKNAHEVLKRIAEGKFQPPEVANPIVGSGLGRILRKALAHDPDDRYRSVDELKIDLERFLNDAAITDSRGELQDYFADPTGYGLEFQERVVLALTERGKAALDHRDPARALEYFDRVLSYDPKNRDVVRYIENLARRQRWLRTSVVAAILVLVGALSYGIFRFWPLLQISTPPTAEVATTTAPTTSATTTRVPSRGPAPRSRPGRGTLAKPVPRPTTAVAALPKPGQPRRDDAVAVADTATTEESTSVAVTPARPRFVEIVPTPKALRIWLNDRDLGPYGPNLRQLKLPAGPVTLAFRNDTCCFEKVVRLAPRDRPKTLRIALPWKPGRVRVTVNPEVDARVLIGSVVTQPGQPVSVPIPSYVEDGQTEVDIRVMAEGYQAARRRVVVRANTTRSVAIELSRAQ